jgi:hypothetical protein
MATKLSPVGSQFQVNQITANDQTVPDITPLSDGRFVVVFNSFFDAPGTDIDVYGQFVNANGTLSGGSIPIAAPNGIQQNPAVAARSDGGFTTVWQDSGTGVSPSADPDIYYAVTNSAGTNTVGRSPLMAGANVLQDPDIATMSDFRQIIVAERAVDASSHDVVFDVLAADGTTQLFAASGFASLPGFALGTLQRNPHVAGGPNRALLVYQDNAGEADASEFHITARLFNGASNTFGSAIPIADAPGGSSDLAPNVVYIGDGRFAITYYQVSGGAGLFARIYNSDTGALSPQIAVNTAPIAGALYANVAATQDGGFVVTWGVFVGPAPDTSAYSVHERRFDPYGNPFGDDFVVNTLTDDSQYVPAIAITGGNVLTAWDDFASRPGDTDPRSIQAQAATTPGFNYDSAAYGDFDNNGRNDLLYQNLSTGAVAIWTTNSAGVAAAIAAPGSLPAGYKIDGTGNFNSTPGDDILLRNGSGQVAVWVTSGTAVVDFKVLGSTSAAYLNAGNGDFTGDGQSDLLFRHAGTGEIASWQVVNNALAAPAKVLGSAPNVYQIVAVADFTGDHQADILFRNLGTGEIAEWQVANNQLLSAQVVGSTASVYHVVGTGDFDGNGANDILFRHDNGQLVMWLLNSAGQLLSAPQAVATVSNIYHVDGTGDLNGDGRSDIIFRDPSGNVIEWLMNGAAAQAIQTVGAMSQDFSIAAHHFDLI